MFTITSIIGLPRILDKIRGLFQGIDVLLRESCIQEVGVLYQNEQGPKCDSIPIGGFAPSSDRV